MFQSAGTARVPFLRFVFGRMSATPGVNRFWVGLFAFLAVHLALRLLISTSLEPDDADLAMFSQVLAWGYSEQPPFYSWLVWGFVRVFGLSIFTLTLVKSLILGWLIVSVRNAATLTLRDQRLVLPVVMGVVLQPTFSWHAVSYLTHSLLLCAVCMALLARLIRLRSRRSTIDYVALGLLVGLGVLSKYNFAFFAAALLAASLSLKAYREALFDRRILISTCIVAALVVPHALWVLENWNVVWGTIADKAGVRQPRSLLNVGKGMLNLAQNATLMMLTLFGVAAVLFRPRQRVAVVNGEADRLLGRFFVAVWVLLTVQVVVGGTTKFHERWLQPFALVMPLWLFVRLEGWNIPAAKLRAFVACGLVGMFAVTAARAVQISVGGRDDGVYPLQMDFRPLANAIDANGATIIASDRVVGGNLALQFPDSRVWCVGHHAFRPGYDASKNVVAVWHLNWGLPYPPKSAVFADAALGGTFLPAEEPRLGEVPGVLAGRPTNRFAFVRLHPLTR